ncbi:protein translocase subunit SecF [Halocatena pleomorpha]|uniref:Protein-export membrane protein SecF n=1 Tax=Halocatena pleomorpha TaxID=1785090 RepID=A0A3P3REP9_9EURY|nr:protein translocase subunit SecF [Halocatena pleomorpha]RRJ32007.1 protein translocase subunit SecF [Halocatena pleomorpha]
MTDFEVPDVEYSRYTNRQLAAIPLAVLAVALLIIAGWYVVTGVPVTPGIDFTGGTELQISASDSPDQIEQTFESQLPYEVDSVVESGDSYIVTIQATEQSEVNEIMNTAEEEGYTVQSAQTRSAAFSTDAQRQALIGVAVAFVGMSVLTFVLFRTFVPSIAIVVSAFSDIMIPVALMNVFGIPLSLGTVAALLMLIGYSVDSDILLNNSILRRRGDFYESTYRARRTGVTMTLTSIVAMVVMTIFSSPLVFGIPLLPDIGLILVFGLTADLMNTYLLNVSLLRYYKYEGVAG